MREEITECCYAPIFREHSLVEAIIVSVLCNMVIGVLFPFSRIAQVSCLIRQCQFRIRHCLRGNDNPNIPV